MMKATSILVAASLVICVSIQSVAATWYVDGSVAASGDGTSSETAFQTIQKGIDAALDGDTVIVTEGTYIEYIQFNGKDIVLRSTNPLDSSVVENTKIVGGQTGPVVTFSGTEDETCALSGFTVNKGRAVSGQTSGFGGGICGGTRDAHTRAAIQNNVLSNNQADKGGGGIAFCDGKIEDNIITDNSVGPTVGNGGGLFDCRAVIQNNTISSNSVSAWGGGLCQCRGTIQNNIISGNYAKYSGGGLYQCFGYLQDNVITRNSAGQRGGGLAECGGTLQRNTITGNRGNGLGGGVASWEGTIQNNVIQENTTDWNGGGIALCDGTVQNNEIVGNSAGRQGGGLCWCDGVIQNNTINRNSAAEEGSGLSECRGAIRNCIIWANSSSSSGGQLYESSIPSFSCVQFWSQGGTGNISDDPRFVNSAEGDYHLQSTSPCIDAGLRFYWFTWPQRSLDGNCRLARRSVDMGCYEYGSSLDSDGDLLSDEDEAPLGTNPNREDTDGDSLRDGLEILRGTDPLAPNGPGLIHVPSDLPTLQMAVCLAVRGDEIVVAPGTYGENIQFCRLDIVLRGCEPANRSVVASTILDGRGEGPVVRFIGLESEACVLSGFTIQNGKGYRGGGICGGIGRVNTHATINNNIIARNYAESGGGVAHCDGNIRNNIVWDNRAERSGGGLFGCNGTIKNSGIHGNSADRGGGLSNCPGTVESNAICGNSANEGAGLISCSGVIRNCIIWDNQGAGEIADCPLPTFCCIRNWVSDGEGNMAFHPYFVDAMNGDYHLKSYSPCIDAGDPASPFSEEPQPNGGRINMGAFGNTPEAASKSSDTDNDQLPDDWEIEVFGHLAQSGSDDPDGDSISNLDEYRSGRSPGAPPATWYVDSSVSSSGDGTSWETAFQTIQEGIDAAVDADTIIVAPGVYLENIHFKGKNLALCSTDPGNSSIVAKTIIDGNEAGPTIAFAGTEKETCLLSGFTIRNGNAPDVGGISGGSEDDRTLATITNNVITANTVSGEPPFGYGTGAVCYCNGPIENNLICDNKGEGAGVAFCDGTIQHNTIYGNPGAGLSDCHGTIQSNAVFENSSTGISSSEARIRDNTIRNNSGGGISRCLGTIDRNTISENGGTGIWSCPGLIQYNTITANRGAYGGGIGSCHGTIRSNVIRGNVSSGKGGGVHDCDGYVVSNLIVENSAAFGGGGLFDCDGTIQNNTICRNTTAERGGGGLRACGGAIWNCIIWQNTAGGSGDQLSESSLPSFSCIQGWQDWMRGARNIAQDPLFTVDYRLQPESPCIDAGALYHRSIWPQRDLDGNCRLIGNAMDMGCYEYGSSLDSDGDFLADRDESARATDPVRLDTDGDGLRDGVEILRGSDPLVSTGPSEIHVPSNVPVIQTALFVALAGDEIVVARGTYRENLRFFGLDILLRSSDPEDAEIVASTIIDGGAQASVVCFTGKESESCVLSGFTIQNGNADAGGGICGGTSDKHAMATIRNNVISENQAEYGGGLAYCDGTIEWNTISKNSTHRYPCKGGGLYACDGAILNNWILNNSVEGYDCRWDIHGNRYCDYGSGGGLARCHGIIRNNLIAGNWVKDLGDADSSASGGGLSDCDGLIQNNTIAQNSASLGNGFSGCNGTISNCIIWKNGLTASSSQPTYSCIQYGAGNGEGNIGGDARFIDPDGPDDNPETYEDNDYRLAPDSPCIDAGLNKDWMSEALDLDVNPRIWAGTVDMGAYEYGSFPFEILELVQVEGVESQLTWNSRPGDTYTVQSCTDLFAGQWNEEQTIASQGQSTIWTDPDTSSARKFYRIGVE